MGASKYILIQRITWTRLIEYSMKQHIPLQELGISTICQERQEWQLARQSSVAWQVRLPRFEGTVMLSKGCTASRAAPCELVAEGHSIPFERW